MLYGYFCLLLNHSDFFFNFLLYLSFFLEEQQNKISTVFFSFPGIFLFSDSFFVLSLKLYRCYFQHVFHTTRQLRLNFLMPSQHTVWALTEPFLGESSQVSLSPDSLLSYTFNCRHKVPLCPMTSPHDFPAHFFPQIHRHQLKRWWLDWEEKFPSLSLSKTDRDHIYHSSKKKALTCFWSSNPPQSFPLTPTHTIPPKQHH